VDQTLKLRESEDARRIRLDLCADAALARRQTEAVGGNCTRGNG